MNKNRITTLFGIEYPIIQGGMVWISGWRLASAVSNAGGLGLLGAGSMHPETLVEHIHKMKEATDKPWGVNVPLMYPEIDKLVDILISEGVKIVFTSAGSPKKYTQRFHEAGMKVAHVVSSSKFANLEEGDTMLTLKLISPTRLVKNDLYCRILQAEKEGAAVEDLRAILGQAAAKRGIFEGDLENGELEIGQIASAVKAIRPVSEVMQQLVEEFDRTKATVANL